MEEVLHLHWLRNNDGRAQVLVNLALVTLLIDAKVITAEQLFGRIEEIRASTHELELYRSEEVTRRLNVLRNRLIPDPAAPNNLVY